MPEIEGSPGGSQNGSKTPKNPPSREPLKNPEKCLKNGGSREGPRMAQKCPPRAPGRARDPARKICKIFPKFRTPKILLETVLQKKKTENSPVPTGRVIKYPTKCALFRVFPVFHQNRGFPGPPVQDPLFRHPNRGVFAPSRDPESRARIPRKTPFQTPSK